ncbi:MAG: tetratricopeptide repeat protein [Planctomycetota bacterium]|nr:tetratricopeptide repeat protein [Planctomycetota bacterium]
MLPFDAMDLSRFLDKAEQALRKRNPAQAIALYKQVLVASPGHGGARAGLLAAYRRRVELKGGASFLDRAAAKSLRAAAAGLAGAQQAAALLKTCEAGLEKNPGDAQLAARLAEALEQLDRPEEALATWEHRLALDANDFHALKSAGKLLYTLRRVQEAIAYLDRAHALGENDPELEKLRKHLAAEGTLASTRFESATSSRELARHPEAMRKVEVGRRIHRTEDQLKEDIESLRKAFEQAPQDVDLCRQLARTQLRGADLEGAERTIRTGLEHHSEEDSLLDLAGDVALGHLRKAVKSAGQDEAASKAAQRAFREAECQELSRRLARKPGDLGLQAKLARSCYRSGDTEQAIEHFQSVATDPRYEVEARQGLGACFTRKGLLPLARRQFEQALDLVGGPQGGDRGKEICYSLGLVCERMGDTSQALARFMEVYEIDIHYKDVASKIDEFRT